MPTYQYACSDCGHRFDAVQKFTDDSLTVCPECGGVLRKVYGSVGVVFKGSGWYRTDSRSGPAVAAGKTDAGKTEAGATKSDSGGDSKKSSSSDSGSGSSSGSDSAAKSSPSTAASTPSSTSAGSSSSGSTSNNKS